MKLVGVLGGTFDPVHSAHLRLAIEAQEYLALDELVLLPAPRPRLRDVPQASPEERLELLEAAASALPGIRVDARELRSEGATRTVETLTAMREEPGCSVAEMALVFIMGMDAFRRLDEWHDYQRLLGLTHLLVMRRPGSPLPDDGEPGRLLREAAADRPEAARERGAGCIFSAEGLELEISATLIRERIAAGRSIQFLVPDPVRELIAKRGMYKHAK